jgi:hypothetical protein
VTKQKGTVYSREQLLCAERFTPPQRDWLSALLPPEGCTLEEADKRLEQFMEQEAK